MTETATTETLDPLATPWHRESYERFLNEYLPALLGGRLTLESYEVAPAGPHATRLTLRAAGAAGEATYDLPRPDADGVFHLPALSGTRDGERRVVPALASSEDLEAAEVACVGEQLRDEVAGRLASLPGRPAAPLSETLPLAEWVTKFLGRVGQRPDWTNPLAQATHRRRLFVRGEIAGFHPSHIGRVCPIETPEGPNCGRVLHVARGATVRDGRVVVLDASPAAGLGLAASLIPFLSHSEPARTLMGANMMRQWHPLPAAEPPLVQTGQEPAPLPLGFWCGVNLLTAFVPWGADTHEDGLVLSESAAKRLGHPYPLTAGDKLSNRHGSKGVVARIRPDAEMPHLPDGTPVEIVYSVMGVFTRMNHGQLLEAAAGLVARAEGRPLVAAPYGGPDVAELRSRLEAAGLPPSGMLRLTAGEGGAPLARESAVGHVYWGRTAHDALDKVHFFASGAEADTPAGRPPGQSVGPAEYRLLREHGALRCLYALLVEQSTAPAGARLERLNARLGALGLRTEVTGDRFAVRWAEGGATDGAVPLPLPVRHPWRSGRELTVVAPVQDADPEIAVAFDALREAAERVARMQKNQAPDRLVGEGAATLRQRVRAYADALLSPDLFRPEARVRRSGRAVLAPGPNLDWDQVGLPEQIARGLFGEGEAAEERMRNSWVLLNRKPSLYPTSLVAFRPVPLRGEAAIRLHPQLCNWFECDFDGDQMAVFALDDPAAQAEAAELLSVRGHLRRDPSLLTEPHGQSRFPFAGLLPTHAALYGLAELARTEGGRRDIAALLGAEPASVSRAGLSDVLAAVLRDRGVDETLEVIARLARLGFDAAKASGASMSPLLGADLGLPPAPDEEAPDAWDAWGDEVTEAVNALAQSGDHASDETGPYLLSAGSGARGRAQFLAKAVASVAPGAQADPWGRRRPMRHGWRDGLTPDELMTVVANTRRLLRQMNDAEAGGEAQAGSGTFAPHGSGLLARALRARRPGVVLANAAAGETDPLTDPGARLFLGLETG